MQIYRRILEKDRTLAMETSFGSNLAHQAARGGSLYETSVYSQSFINSYMTLLVDNGVDIAATDEIGETPLYCAALYRFPKVVDFLARHLTSADDINRASLYHNETPLGVAVSEAVYHEWEPPNPTIRTLLMAGADVPLLPTVDDDAEDDPHVDAGDDRYLRQPSALRRQRQLVLSEYREVLNDLPKPAMAALNAALAPHRSLAALLTPRLAVGPQEAPFFGWRIASYLFDTEAVNRTITDTLLPFRHTDMARRVCTAIEHFVKSALEASSNREVVGPMANVGGQMVRVPLQCFAVRGQEGGQPRLLGVREVVHKARLDEAARHGVEGVVKGFDDHLGNEDCQFEWQHLGYINKQGQFESLGIN
ncbi:unnamed protein product [Vitrella brassicaformis CCMP3155]|uniref:Uncharacterized protein n=2 Tax=Vitrella brassicaformis TaxID=1169539 RepID=A0A0G4ETQ2_VITBC|nr:unnamed protein product [Vitrella brassicaformis CCMP3155]|eukprot:CEM01629.1 unnamed protein product [Vitrella brassicaformis CCMP3155]